MFTASKDITLPTSIIGSLPRPSWFTANLGTRSFLQGMVDITYREQYTDAVSTYLRMQEVAGVDIVTDGDAHYDQEVGGSSWMSYPQGHMGGYERAVNPEPVLYKVGGTAFPMGHILHDYLEARVVPRIVGPIGRGQLQYTEMWKAAQRLTKKPVKFGTITPELLAAGSNDHYYTDPVERTYAFSNALNEELTELASAGCPVIQMEEPQIHMVPARGPTFGKLGMKELAEVFDNTVKGLGDKAEVWCHTCWGNPSQQRMFLEIQSYKPALETLNALDCDVLTFETASSGTDDLKKIGEICTDKKICIGVIDHHTLQVERPDEVAALIREALKYIPAERLMISSDCGMGREGMSRRHAAYKLISMVLGTNIVRKELGLPEAEVMAANTALSLARVEEGGRMA